MTIRGGEEIVLETDHDAEPALLRHLVNGIGLGLALHQRNVLTLHGSAISIGGTAVAVVGGKGSGKSTLAAALAARGHTVLSDDVVALDLPPGEQPTVRSGPPSLNLWPDAAAATGHDPIVLDRIWSRSTKRAGWLNGGSRPVSTPLQAIIVRSTEGGSARPPLGPPLAPLDAMTQLIRHSHALRWVHEGACLPWHLRECARLLDRVPVLVLPRAETLDDLLRVVPDLERAASGVGAPRATGGAVDPSHDPRPMPSPSTDAETPWSG